MARRRKRVPPRCHPDTNPGASLRREYGSARIRPIVFRGDKAPTDSVSVTSGRVACSSSSAPRVGPGRVAGERVLGEGTRQLRDPANSISDDGNSGTGLSMGAEDDGDRWGGIPRIHPELLVRIGSDQIGWEEITVWPGEVNCYCPRIQWQLVVTPDLRRILVFSNALGTRAARGLDGVKRTSRSSSPRFCTRLYGTQPLTR